MTVTNEDGIAQNRVLHWYSFVIHNWQVENPRPVWLPPETDNQTDFFNAISFGGATDDKHIFGKNTDDYL